MKGPEESTPQSILRINDALTIPLDELHFSFSRSSGPGGQNVNRTATKVELTFDVRSSPSLTLEQRALIFHRLTRSIDQEGILHLTSQSSRSQLQNREDALARFQTLLAGALRVARKRVPTRPSRASKEERLRGKHVRKLAKRARRRVGCEEW